MTKDRVPNYTQDPETGEWVIEVDRAAPVRTKDSALCQQIWNLAMWSYHNGRDDKLKSIKETLGL